MKKKFLMGMLIIVVITNLVIYEELAGGQAQERQTLPRRYVTAGPVILYVPLGGTLALGGRFRILGDEQKLGPYLLVKKSVENDPFTLIIDYDFRVELKEKFYQYSAVAGTGEFLVRQDKNVGTKVLIPFLDAQGKFPGIADSTVKVPFTRVPDISFESLAKYLTSPDWFTRAAAAWVIGERGYKQGVGLLLDAIKREERAYSACFQAAAIKRLGDSKAQAELEKWLTAPGRSEVEKELKSRFSSICEDLAKPISQ